MTRSLLKKRKRRNIEASIQSDFFLFLRLNYPELCKICFAIPNGGSRNIIEAYNLKCQGVTAGVPDVFCAFPSGKYHGLFIEFKSGKNKLSEKQVKMIERLEEKGYQCIICYSLKEAVEGIEDYMRGW